MALAKQEWTNDHFAQQLALTVKCNCAQFNIHMYVNIMSECKKGVFHSMNCTSRDHQIYFSRVSSFLYNVQQMATTLLAGRNMLSK